MQAFVDRRTVSGAVFGNPDERLTPRQALAAYTFEAAAATGTAHAKGTLTPGKLADFTVLSGSPLTAPDIADLQVLATAVGGAFTHGESSFRSPVRTGQTVDSPSSGTTFISTATNCS
jgi:predicted amidohydrolase YtcJ